MRVGLLDHGFAENLEESEPSAELAAQLEDVDLIISTGCVGYVTDVTFRRLLQGVKSTVPWVASFALRLYPFDSIAACLAGAGIETEKLESVTFVQRRFHSEREYAETITTLERLGIDTTGKEADGLLHAELWVSRPRAEAAFQASGATVYVAREFITMDPKKPRAQAVAVKDGKFVEIGTRAEVETAVDRGAKVDTTFAGKVVMPGFVEQHVHLVLAALTMSTTVISIEDWDAINLAAVDDPRPPPQRSHCSMSMRNTRISRRRPGPRSSPPAVS